jgi:CheY-like chemotaxis protein
MHVGVAVGASSGENVVNLVTGLAWPVLVGVILWRLLPSIRDVVRSRAFTVKAGGMEISVQQASDQLASRLEDLREHVIGLGEQVAPDAGAEAGESPEGVAAAAAGGTVAPRRLQTLLWVDDYPENNAFEVDTLKRKGVDVIQAATTDEALGAVRGGRSVDVIVTDMGRQGEGDDAGLKLLRALRDLGITTPVIVYASAPAVARTRSQALELGAMSATSSATELFDLLARLGLPK